MSQRETQSKPPAWLAFVAVFIGTCGIGALFLASFVLSGMMGSAKKIEVPAEVVPVAKVVKKTKPPVVRPLMELRARIEKLSTRTFNAKLERAKVIEEFDQRERFISDARAEYELRGLKIDPFVDWIIGLGLRDDLEADTKETLRLLRSDTDDAPILAAKYAASRKATILERIEQRDQADPAKLKAREKINPVTGEREVLPRKAAAQDRAELLPLVVLARILTVIGETEDVRSLLREVWWADEDNLEATAATAEEHLDLANTFEGPFVVPELREARKLVDILLAAQPESRAYLRLSAATDELTLLHAKPRNDLALAKAKQVLKIREEELTIDPDSPATLGAYARCAAIYGSIEPIFMVANSDTRLQIAEEALQRCERMIEEDEAARAALAEPMLALYDRLAELLPRPESSIGVLKTTKYRTAAVETQDFLVEKRPESNFARFEAARRRYELALAKIAQAVMEGRSKLPEADAALLEALELRETLVERHPGSIRAKLDLCETLRVVAERDFSTLRIAEKQRGVERLNQAEELIEPLPKTPNLTFGEMAAIDDALISFYDFEADLVIRYGIEEGENVLAYEAAIGPLLKAFALRSENFKANRKSWKRYSDLLRNGIRISKYLRAIGSNSSLDQARAFFTNLSEVRREQVSRKVADETKHRLEAEFELETVMILLSGDSEEDRKIARGKLEILRQLLFRESSVSNEVTIEHARELAPMLRALGDCEMIAKFGPSPEQDRFQRYVYNMFLISWLTMEK